MTLASSPGRLVARAKDASHDVPRSIEKSPPVRPPTHISDINGTGIPGTRPNFGRVREETCRQPIDAGHGGDSGMRYVGQR